MTEITAWLEFSAGERVIITDLCTIGRIPGNRVVIPSERVSRRHAVIRRIPDGSFELMDMGSSNGTWVNGQRLTRPLSLRNGMIVEVGFEKMTFRVAQNAAPATPTTEAVPTPAWMLAVEATTRGCREPAEGSIEKTYEGWSERCERIIRKYHGVSVRALQDGFLSYWTEEAGSDKSPLLATVLRSLRAVQSLTEEFRFVLHYGEVEMHTGPSGERRPTGAEFIHVLQLQKLVRVVDAAVLVTEPAAQKLGPALPTRLLNKREMREQGGTAAFYTLNETKPNDPATTAS